jgi:hypothetical protein
MLSAGVVMHHDNACPHTAATMQDLIVTFGREQFDHALLVPSGSYVFQHLKTFLSGRQFHNDSEVKEAK